MEEVLGIVFVATRIHPSPNISSSLECYYYDGRVMPLRM